MLVHNTCSKKTTIIESSETRNAGQYHTFFKVDLESDLYFSSDPVQFRDANKKFIDQLNNDNRFKKDMFKRHPELKDWMDDKTKLSNSPAGFTWHHSEETGVLRLVDRLDHRHNFSIYHPTGKGGRDIWGGGRLGRTGKLDKNGNLKK